LDGKVKSSSPIQDQRATQIPKDAAYTAGDRLKPVARKALRDAAQILDVL